MFFSSDQYGEQNQVKSLMFDEISFFCVCVGDTLIFFLNGRNHIKLNRIVHVIFIYQTTEAAMFAKNFVHYHHHPNIYPDNIFWCLVMMGIPLSLSLSLSLSEHPKCKTRKMNFPNVDSIFTSLNCEPTEKFTIAN